MIILLGLQVGIFLAKFPTKVQLKSEASAQSGAGFVLQGVQKLLEVTPLDLHGNVQIALATLVFALVNVLKHTIH